jgi:hypothetical protein
LSSIPTSVPDASVSDSSKRDLLNELPTPVDSKSEDLVQPSSSNTNESNFRPSENISETSLIKSIPVAFKSQASELLFLLKNNPDIFWDKEGKLFLQNEMQKDANFFELYPQLFQAKNSHQIPMLQSLANFISTEGYGHFLHNFHTTGLILNKKKKLGEERSEIKKRLKIGDNWFYLGP